MTLTRFSRPRTVRWSPNTSFGDLFQEVEQLFQPLSELSRGSVGVYQPIDLFETDEAVVLQMAVPGVRTEDLDISIEGRQVTIRGTLQDDDVEGRRYWLRGMLRGDFSRTVTVPSGIDADAIEASVEQGVLTLKMPKAPEAMARKIAINGAEGAEAVRTIETETVGA
ncbi:MAG TPA: Hsp20/alpha crystallin family protein [Trueperaceae bacterium]